MLIFVAEIVFADARLRAHCLRRIEQPHLTLIWPVLPVLTFQLHPA